MDFKKLPSDLRNQNIINISVVLNTIDAVSFPNILRMCMADYDRVKFINLIQETYGNKIITKDDVYTFCVSFEQNIKEQ